MLAKHCTCCLHVASCQITKICSLGEYAEYLGAVQWQAMPGSSTQSSLGSQLEALLGSFKLCNSKPLGRG